MRHFSIAALAGVLGVAMLAALVSSIYMIPLKELNAQKAFSDMTIARERADHEDIVFNAGASGSGGAALPRDHLVRLAAARRGAGQMMEPSRQGNFQSW